MQSLVETVATAGDNSVPRPHIDTYHRELLLQSLRRPGVRIPEINGFSAAAMGGVAQTTSVRRVLDSAVVARHFEQRLQRNIGSGNSVTLSLTDLHGAEDSIRAFQQFCEYVCSVVSKVGFNPQQLGLALRSHQIPLKAFSVLSNSILGHGPRYVYLDDLQMHQHTNRQVREESERNWRFLWQQRRASNGLVPIYGGVVRSACRLLSDEVAFSVLPANGTLVPAQTAWLPVEVDLSVVLKNAHGKVDREALCATIGDVIDTLEKLHDDVLWSCARQRADSHLHRRLALTLCGLGQLVINENRDPRALTTLAWLCEIVKLVRDEAQRRSAELAQSLGPLPAIDLADPATALSAGSARERWRQQWQAAVQTCALRHRNLLVMSPYSVLPETTTRSTAFSDLLPVIRFADAWCFSTTATMANWSMNEFQQFHRRAWAIVHGHRRGCVVAAGV